MTSDLLDVNFLLALEASKHVHLATAREWLATHSQRSRVLCRVTQMGLLRLLTNKAVMSTDLLSVKEAWEQMGRIREREDVVWREEPASFEAKWKTLSLLGGPRGSWWTDAYLAAFAIGHALRSITFDSGYRRFESKGLELLVLPPLP